MATFARGHWTQKTTLHNEAVQRSITRESHQTSTGKVTWIITAGDELTLRGIPAIGRGVPGVIRGTNPGNV
jgi:hypothetical protein